MNNSTRAETERRENDVLVRLGSLEENTARDSQQQWLVPAKSTLHSNLHFPSRLSDKGQIRLLKVQPEVDENQVVRCELETVHLKDNPNYVALSYTWGPPTTEAASAGITSIPTHAIRCNGEAMLVTQNLHDFIRRARYDPELNSQRLWVDAICTYSGRSGIKASRNQQPFI